MGALVDFALRQRVLVVVLLAIMLLVGVASFLHLNIEAYPDPVPPMVDVVTQNAGQPAEDMERYVTIPIEVQLAGIPNVSSIRTTSMFGLSDVRVQFTYDFTYDEAQQRVINRLSQLGPLPNNVQPQISPQSPVGEIFRYRLVGPPGYSVLDLKTLQDWVLQRRFKAVPGVIDVTGWGGKSRAYEVQVDLRQLLDAGVTMPQLVQAINNANVNVGGQTIQFGEQSAVVRGVGLVQSPDDIGNTLVTLATGNVPVRVRDLAQVRVSHLPRLGIAGQDQDDDIVQGIVLMRRGAESTPTIRAVEAEMQKLQTDGTLPPGVHIERIYDRSELVGVTTHTVLHNMVLGVVLIFFVQWIFLGDLRSAIIVSTTIPFALAFAVTMLKLRGESANLLSVGAIDFGLVVDATVIMVENIYRHLVDRAQRKTSKSTHRVSTRLATIAEASLEVNRAIFFSAAIIIAGFLPLFTMTGVEGHIFGPMAKTYGYAIAGGLLATFTVAPALSALLLRTRLQHVETRLLAWIRRRYEPLLQFALLNRRLTLGATAVLLLFAALLSQGLGLEFLPKLEEGNLWIRATAPTSISLEASSAQANGIRRILTSFPEVRTAISQTGRPDDGTDTTGFYDMQFYVPLRPASEWPQGPDKEKLTARVSQALHDKFPGTEFAFSQYIADNVEEAASGVKGENSIKIFGNDLAALESTAGQIRQILSQISGIEDLAIIRSLGQPTLQIDVDRARAARYGLSVSDVNTTIQAAIGGQAAGNLYERGADRFFPIVVRLAPDFRADLDTMRRIPIGAPSPTGNGIVQVPLGEVATLRMIVGANQVFREGQQRYVPIRFSVRGRDLGSAILEAQQRIQTEVKLPAGIRLDWVGEFGSLQQAIDRLAIMVPVGLLLICLLLYVNFGSIVDMLLAASAMPMALVGGVLALAVTGTPFSVSAAIGFVALFGIAAMDGIIVLSCFNNLVAQGVPRYDALVRTGQLQLRPVLMTCIAACVGLIPAALSTGIGSQVQRPLALVVVGGMLLAPALILLAFPVLVDLVSRRGVAGATAAQLQPAE